MVFLTLGIIGFIGYLLGCKRPTPEELLAKEIHQTAPDNEFLLDTDRATYTNGMSPQANEYNNDQDYPYKSSALAGRTRFGHSTEDMV